MMMELEDREGSPDRASGGSSPSNGEGHSVHFLEFKLETWEKERERGHLDGGQFALHFPPVEFLPSAGSLHFSFLLSSVVEFFFHLFEIGNFRAPSQAFQ